MANNSTFQIAYNVLNEVLREGAFVQVALSRALQNGGIHREQITKLVYGVTEKSGELDEILSRYAKSVKPAIRVLLKLGIYAILYMDATKDYAAVSECTEVSKGIHGGNYSAFVNAVLRRVAGDAANITTTDRLSVPEWLQTKLLEVYGEAKTTAMLCVTDDNRQHVRVSKVNYSMSALYAKLDSLKLPYARSSVGGVFVKKCPPIDRLFADGKITYQSPSSVLCVQALSPIGQTAVLDVCAAPGGKSVLMAELQPTAEIIACDILPHRVELIRKYARRMCVENVTPLLLDATVNNAEYNNKFDFVMCDAPCSGSGVLRSKPDILLKLKPEDIQFLSARQAAILDNVSRYVKRGGVLLYSTCSVLPQENDAVVNAFLAKHAEFSLERMPISRENNGMLQLLPDEEYDGFFMARLVRRSV